MNKETALQAVLAASDMMRLGNEFLIGIQGTEPTDEFKAWRLKIANVFGAICDEIYNPVFKEFPEIKEAIEKGHAASKS